MAKIESLSKGAAAAMANCLRTAENEINKAQTIFYLLEKAEPELFWAYKAKDAIIEGLYYPVPKTFFNGCDVGMKPTQMVLNLILTKRKK